MKQKINLIGISGKKGSGKNTVASLIQNIIIERKDPLFFSLEDGESSTILDSLDKNNTYGYYGDISGWQQKAFASKVKQIASIITGIPFQSFEIQSIKSSTLPSEWTIVEEEHVSHALMSAHRKQDRYKGSTISYATSLGYREVYNGKHSFFVREVKRLMTVREILQKIGTEMGRQIHPETWVNALFAEYISKINVPEIAPGAVPDIEVIYPNWIITDVRFPNEVRAIQNRGGIVIRVERNKFSYDTEGYKQASEYLRSKGLPVEGFQSSDGFSVVNEANSVFAKEDTHISETALDNWKFDYTIINDGSLEDLKNKVEKLLIELNII